MKITTISLSKLLHGRSLSSLVADLLRADAKSYTTPDEFLTRNKTFFTTDIERPPYTPTATTVSTSTDEPLAALHTLSAALTLVPESHWTVDAHRANITDYLNATTENKSKEEKKALTKEIYHYLRWALSGGASGPGIPETMAILGREETIRRLTEAREATKKSWKKYSLPGAVKQPEGSGEV
ncbi:hypothetical protein VTN49DRAFT_1017 [Thermomyces lanuginosus]|uniref:uncharacterized protein n=1 Tax=Thermomyces lanuginosus TaxID=5541 RepID=UPI003742696D